MNKTCYRIVFNKVRGLLMAVAETVTGQGKTKGETSANASAPTSPSRGPLIATVCTLTFSVWAMLGMVLSPSVHAQIVADPSAPGNQRPTVLAAPNNVPLVNIQTPSSAGVSRNTYSQFDVQQQGAILNNSRTNVQTQLGGWVQGNPWLATGSARVILNEVNSNNPSLLRGYVEVAGQRAQVVIANPAGVTCDGCGFINANRATVTTGTPVVNGGSLEGYRVQGGTVTITGNGMDASTTDYTDLIARAVQVHAGIWANQLKVVAGANQVTVDQTSSDASATSTLAGTGTAPAFAIDVGQLGGMYAGKITLIGTEAGVGVSNAGKLYAGVGEVVVTIDGRFENAGQVTSTTHTQIDSERGIQNSGTLYAQGNANLSTRGNVDNTGTVAATGNTTVLATGATSQITSANTSVLGAGVQTNGSLGTTGNLTVNATQALTAQGQNLSGSDQALSAQAINLSGSQTSARNLTATASNGDINLASATVAIGQTLTASASQTLRTDNANISATQINATAHDLSNVQGTLIQTGSGDLTLNLPGTLNNTQGRIATNSANLNVTAATLTNTDGKLEHAGTGALTIVAPTLSGARGQITSNGLLDLTATTSTTLDAASTTAKQLKINSKTLSNRGGTLTQTGSGATTLAASTLLDNTGGTIASNGHTTLTVGALTNQGGLIQAAGPSASNLTLNATGNIDNSNVGKILASGNTTITGDSLNNTQGQITASQVLNASTTQAINNSQGLLAANNQVTLSAAQVNNSAGTIGSIQSGASVTASTGTINNSGGRIEAALALSVSALGITNTDGTMTGKSLLANSNTQTLDNTRGQLIASGTGAADTLNLQTGALNNDRGLIQATSAITVNTHGLTLTNTNSGTSSGIVGQSTVDLKTGDFTNQAGYVGSGTGLTINSSAITNTEGWIATNGTNLDVTATTLTNTDGKLEHAGTGALTIAATTISGKRGRIASNGLLDLAATSTTLDSASTTAKQLKINSSTLSNRGGTLTQTGSGATTIAASTQLDNTDGTIASNGHTTLTVGALTNQGGLIQAAGPSASNLTLNATGNIDNSNVGKISASGNTTVTGDSLSNTQGQITAAQVLNASTTQAINNSQGLLAANNQVTLSAAQINNSAGTIGSIQSGASVTASTGTINNSGGRIEAALALSVSALGITNTDGTMTGKSLLANSNTQTLDNTRGQLIASGTGAADTLNLQTGALNNDRGLIQATSAITVNTHGLTLTNTNSGTSSGIVGQSTVDLNTGDFTNQAGYVGSGAGLTINSAAITNTQGGILASSAQAALTGSSLNNQGGQIQALGNIDVTLSGTLNNTASLVRSGQTLTVNASGITNTNTQGSNQGLEAQAVSLSANQINNSQGAIRANNDVTLTSSGSVGNSQGLISAGKTLKVQDLGATKTLAITNTSGTLIAGQNLVVDSSGLSGDGSLLSQGDMNVKLTQNYVHTGQLTANGTANLETTGTLTNQSTLQAGTALNLKAATINNQANGKISGSKVKLQATDSHTLTNRGLIDGTDTLIETITLNNLGTGRIYGDHVAIAATTVTNDAENGVAPVIAARNRLDIGADTINNREHALIFSAGDLAIGGSLDASKRATGSATTLNNASATIEALGQVDINARQINNTNEHFSTTVDTLPAQGISEYQGAGSPNRYTPGAPDVYIYNDESDHLHTPEGNYESWSAYNYTRNTTETRVASSDPAQILSGSAMRIASNTLTNDKSRIIAGGALTGTIATLNNTEVAGERTITDAGSVTSYWRNHQKGRDSTGSSSGGYNPAVTIQAISLTPTVYQQNTVPSGTGTQISALSTATVNQSPAAASGATATINSGQVIAPISQVATLSSNTNGPITVAINGGQVITPITQVAALNNTSASGPATVVRSGGVNTSVPNNRLFSVTPNLSAHYLIETDPAFANYRSWLSSDYLLTALSINPATTQKRLGDGFYEQKLIREQVALLTGRRFLDGYANDEAQYQALMNNSVTYATAHSLIPGVSLSAAQMAQLTSDIVWLVEKDITLPGGTTTKALVPQLYVHVQEGDLQAGGALIAGNSVNFNLTGDLTNSGTIAGRTVVALTAENIQNLGGRITGQDVGIAARGDLNNIAGAIVASNSLIASAGNDLNVISTTRSQSNAQGTRTNIDRVAGLYVTGSGGTLLAQAGRDINLNAAAILNAAPPAAGTPAGSTTLLAAKNLNLGTVTESASNRVVWDGNNRRSDSSRTDVGTAIQTQGDLTLQAGNDLNVKAANVVSSQGALLVTAGNNVNLTAGQANQTVDEAHQHKGRSSVFSSTTTTTRDTLDATTALGTTLSGKTATVLANQDINVKGGNVVSDSGTLLAAQNNLNIQAATNTIVETHLKDEKKSGIFSGGGISLTIGTQQQSAEQKGTTTTAAASTIGSTQGNVNLSAGQAYKQTGSDVMAPVGDVNITAKKVDIVEARETSNSETETKFKQSGLTVAVTSPVISAIQTAQQMSQAASNTSDSRMQVLAAANVAMAAKNAVDAVKVGQGTTINGKDNQMPTKFDDNGKAIEGRDARADEKAGGINISISVGSSSSASKTTQTSDTARESNVAAGNNVNITATGAGQASDLLIQGTNVKAGNRVTLNADDEIKLLAAKNTADQHSTNSNRSGSLGISFGTDGLLLTASASGGRGKADGSDVNWTNTHVEAGNQVTMNSGGDTTVKGAVVTAPQITANVGGNLNVESLQDTSKFDSKQQSIGGSISVGYGKMGGSFSASKSKVDSDFASVTEQSGLRAGDQGFNVNVANNTDLKGGAITSTQKAIDDNKNNFSTGGELTTSDIQNQASYKASSVGVSVGTGVSLDGKLAPQGTSAGFGKDSGNASSTTQAAISGVAGNTAARTGDAETGIQKIFDADKVQKDINAQVLITQTFGREASKAVATYAANKIEDIKAQQKNETDPDKLKVLQAEQQKWEEGGTYRIALHAAVGGLSGGVQGAVGAATVASAAPTLNDLQDNLAKGLENAGANTNVAKAAAQLITGITAAGIGGVASGGSVAGAATAFNADTNNRQLHPKEIAFLADKDRVKRYVAYMKDKGVVLTEADALKALDQYGAAMADVGWTKVNGRDFSTESFILAEAAKSKDFYIDNNGQAHKFFVVTADEYKNELINLKPLFSAYDTNPQVKKFLENNFDKDRLANWATNYRAGQLAGYADASKNASLLGDAKTILGSLLNAPAYIKESLTSNEVGPFDSQQMKDYYQALLRLQGRGVEAGYVSEYDWATTQRLVWAGIATAEAGGALIKLPGAISNARAAAAAELAEAQAIKKTNLELNIRRDDGDLYGAYRKADGTWNWPPNMGAVPGTEKIVTLQTGYVIDRVGGDGGRFVSPAGVAVEERALAPGSLSQQYSKYEVIKPIPGAVQAEVAPAFGQPGGGQQIYLLKPLKWYVDNGFLREAK